MLQRLNSVLASQVETDFYICGIAPFSQKSLSENQFLLLCYEKTELVLFFKPFLFLLKYSNEGNLLFEEESGPLTVPEDSRPHMRVIEVRPESFEETSLDAVTIKDFEKNRPSDYRLDFIRDEGIFFILGPKDIIKALPRSFDDHIKWLMERQNYEQALSEFKIAPPNSLKHYTYQVS